jgi:hypothetical protein
LGFALTEIKPLGKRQEGASLGSLVMEDARL